MADARRSPEQTLQTAAVTGTPEGLRVFISCSENVKIVNQIQEMLELADIESKTAKRGEPDASPVPDNVFQAMRQCDAGLIVVGPEDFTVDQNGECVLSENVLIEIGAAYVLYNRRVIVLWEKQLALPLNFKDLSYCEFEGNDLTWSAGVGLMKVIKEFKKSNSLGV